MLDKKTEKRITMMLRSLNEKQKRLYLAKEAEALGFGGVKAISEFTGMSQQQSSPEKKKTGREVLLIIPAFVVPVAVEKQ
jgi:hypothetical protein